MTEGVRPNSESLMKVVLSAEQYFSDVRLLLTKKFRKPITDKNETNTLVRAKMEENS